MKPNYETVKVIFVNPIKDIDSEIFRGIDFWGVSTLKEWIDDYESTRFTQIAENVAIITSEYNMGFVKEWLKKNTNIFAIMKLK